VYKREGRTGLVGGEVMWRVEGGWRGGRERDRGWMARDCRTTENNAKPAKKKESPPRGTILPQTKNEVEKTGKRRER